MCNMSLIYYQAFKNYTKRLLLPHCTMCKMAHFARNAVSSDDLNIVPRRANLGDHWRAGNSGVTSMDL